MSVGSVRIAGTILVLVNNSCALTAGAFGALEMEVLRPYFYPPDIVGVDRLLASDAQPSHAVRVIVHRTLLYAVHIVRVDNSIATWAPSVHTLLMVVPVPILHRSLGVGEELFPTGMAVAG